MFRDSGDDDDDEQVALLPRGDDEDDDGGDDGDDDGGIGDDQIDQILTAAALGEDTTARFDPIVNQGVMAIVDQIDARPSSPIEPSIPPMPVRDTRSDVRPSERRRRRRRRRHPRHRPIDHRYAVAPRSSTAGRLDFRRPDRIGPTTTTTTSISSSSSSSPSPVVRPSGATRGHHRHHHHHRRRGDRSDDDLQRAARIYNSHWDFPGAGLDQDDDGDVDEDDGYMSDDPSVDTKSKQYTLFVTDESIPKYNELFIIAMLEIGYLVGIGIVSIIGSMNQADLYTYIYFIACGILGGALYFSHVVMQILYSQRFPNLTHEHTRDIGAPLIGIPLLAVAFVVLGLYVGDFAECCSDLEEQTPDPTDCEDFSRYVLAHEMIVVVVMILLPTYVKSIVAHLYPQTRQPYRFGIDQIKAAVSTGEYNELYYHDEIDRARRRLEREWVSSSPKSTTTTGGDRRPRSARLPTMDLDAGDDDSKPRLDPLVLSPPATHSSIHREAAESSDDDGDRLHVDHDLGDDIGTLSPHHLFDLQDEDDIEDLDRRDGDDDDDYLLDASAPSVMATSLDVIVDA